MNKNKKIIVVGLLMVVVATLITSLYFYGLTPVKRKSEKVIVTIEPGTSSVDVITALNENKLLKSTISSIIYLKIHSNLNIKAGIYELDRSESTRNIFIKLHKGEIYDDSIKITFNEGKRVTHYATQIKEEFGYTEEEIINTINDKEYLKELINKYWFLTDDVLNDNIYYALEGYLFPDTYHFNKELTIKGIIETMLDNTEKKLEAYKTKIEESDYSIHEILTIGSIIENESMFDEDRNLVSQVIYKRLAVNMSLGMDVTTYYAVKKDLSEELTKSDLASVNAYNTRNTSFKGLPVGPICNMGIKSIEAALNPSDTNYLYFYADIKTGKLYFAENNQEFQKLIETYR